MYVRDVIKRTKVQINAKYEAIKNNRCIMYTKLTYKIVPNAKPILK